MGLVQRAIEAAGISTITLSNVPAVTSSVGVPRLAAIEHPFGLPMGMPGDADTQRAVLRATLQAAETIKTPGGIVHLPWRWPDARVPGIRLKPAEPPPIAGWLARHPWHIPNLIRREIPTM